MNGNETAPAETRHDETNRITVIGLGSMGATLARLWLARGRRVTVWNRSAAKAAPLAALGAVPAATAAEAVAASRVVAMCVYDYAAVRAVLELPGVARAFRARVLVQLTTGSPTDALDAEDWAERHGAAYLEGAIQAAPSQMGQPDTPLMLSGRRATFDTLEPVLREVAGNLIYLGEAIDAASTMDLATLSYVYGAFAGFVHGARLAESSGLDVARYGRIVNAISPSFGAFFEHEAAAIQRNDFRVSESPLRISIEATQRILDASRAAGLNSEVPALFADLLRRAGAAGLADEELAALIKVLRGR